jgi:O-antigen/teichoic acid export membrane protein
MTRAAGDGAAAAATLTRDEVVDQAGVGAKVMTVRGVAMRVVSITSNLLLLALVTPEQLGLYAVVFGISGLIAFSTDLGVGKALLRGARDPTRADYAALAGLQFGVLAIILAGGLLHPALLLGFGALDEQWYGWMLVLLATTFFVPLGTGARVRLERRLAWRRLAIVDVVNVLVQNVGLVAFAVAGRFATGIFIVFAVMHVVVNTLLLVWAPGPWPSPRVRCLWPLARPSAGYMTANVVLVAKERVTPLLVAHLFGLGMAGIWTFAVRIGQLLNVTFEGFRHAAVPAAALLSGDHVNLRRLATDTLRGSLTLAAPLAAIALVSLPVLGELWPQWQSAILLAQVSVLAFAFAGVAGAALEPVAVATRGATAAVVEQVATAGVAWAGFALLAAFGSQQLAWVVPPMNVIPVILLVAMTRADVRPAWRPELMRALLALASAIALYGLLTAAGASPVVVAVVATCSTLVWVRPHRLLNGLGSTWRLAQR